MPDSIPLWLQGAPGAFGSTPHDIPDLTLYPTNVAGSGPAPAMLVLPGGGYRMHASHEGEGYAKWLALRGIHAFVLRYRLGTNGYRHPIMLGDAARGLRTLRANAKTWGIDPGKIGVIGSSAGGHLGAMLMTQWDAGDPASADPVERVSSRPDLGILCYPVISMTIPQSDRGSRQQLLGEMDDGKAEKLNPERNVNSQTPPTFLFHTVEDRAVGVENSLTFAAALRANGVPFALHVYERGRHGLGLDHLPWAEQLLRWLSLRWPIRLDG